MGSRREAPRWSGLATAAILAVFDPEASLRAQLLPNGGELQVNTYTTHVQADPSVAADAVGGFVVAWRSEGSAGTDKAGSSVHARRYAPSGLPLGGSFQVNTYTTGNQFEPVVASAADGRFVVAWENNDDFAVHARRYAAAGTAAGAPFTVVAATYRFDLDMDDLGRFVVVWEHQGFDDSRILGRRYDAGGSPLGDSFAVSTSPYWFDYRRRPAVAMAPDGAFVVVWEDVSEFGLEDYLFARLFDADGDAASGQIQVHVHTASPGDADVGIDEDGDFVVVWESLGTFGDDSDGTSVQARRFASNGTPIGATEFQVNTYTAYGQDYPAVAVDPDGGFVVTWWRSIAGDVYARRYDSSGAPMTGELLVNTYTTFNQFAQAVAADGFGNFVVTWSGLGTANGNDTSDSAVMAQRFDALFRDGFETSGSGRWSFVSP